jgi:hypothetical protein
MVTSEPPVSESEKRDALEAVLSSNTFARSAQLKAFLRHICEMELAGRTGELTEYGIAVEVLGRRKDVDLSDDSSVRNRAYELRQRLEKYYSAEQPAATVRIEIPRGGYAPAFVRHAVPAQVPALTTPLVMVDAGRKHENRIRWIAAAAALVLVSVAAGWLIGSSGQRPKPASILAEAWGPLADPGSDILICIATNLHMLVRPHIPPRTTRMEVPRELYPQFTATRPLGSGETLYMEPAQISVPLAELAGAAGLAATRTAFGGGYQILPEAEAPLTALLGRNGVLIGTPVNSLAASVLLKSVPLTIGFTSGDEFALIDQRKPAGEGVLYTAQPGIEPLARPIYGLLTVLTSSDASGKEHRTLQLTGTGSSAAIQGAVEFFCSAAHMRDLKRRMGGTFPPNYQVVIKCTTSKGRLIGYEYERHVVVEKK